MFEQPSVGPYRRRRDGLTVNILGSTGTAATDTVAVDNGVQVNHIRIGLFWKTYEALESTFAQQDPRDINLHDEGVSPTNTAAVNTAAFRAAIEAAPVGSRLLLPYAADPVLINDALTTTKMLHFEGLGGKAKITQTVWGKPVFDLLNASGSSVVDFELVMSAPRAIGTGNVRDGAARTYACGIWAAASNLRIARVSADGFTAAVRLTNWDDATQQRTGFVTDTVMEDISCENSDWGVVGTGWKRVTVRGITGSYSLTPASADPAHLVYVSDGQENIDVTVVDGVAYDSPAGHAYQFKATDGLTIANLTSRNCAGLLSVADVQNADMTLLRAHEDIGDPNGSLYIQGAGASSNIRVSDVVINTLSDFRSIRTDGVDTTLQNVTVNVTHTTLSENGDVTVQGTRNVLQNVRVVNAGLTDKVWRAIVLVSGVGHVIRDGGGVNVRSFVQPLAAATDFVIEYDPKMTTRNSVAGSRTLALTASVATATVRPARTVTAFATGAGEEVRVRAEETTHANVTVSGATAFTVNSPIEPYLGAEITYLIRNTSGGALGTITWTGHTLATAWTSPATGTTKVIRFVYDGSGWRESFRSA